MSIRTFTPLRQTIRAYSALLNISDKISSIEAAMGAPKAAPRPRSKFDIHDRQGLTLLLDRGSIVDRALIDSDAWEREQLDYLFHLARRAGRIGSMTFVDVGAYFGLYSLLALRTGLFDRIHAFEADRDNFAQLQANLLLNDATHAITAANMAVTDTTGTIRFRDSRTHPDGNRAGVGILDDGADSYPAPATTIDAALPATGAVIVMKIDVEGHEARVLKGMERTLRNNRVVMQVEIYAAQNDVSLAEIARLGLRRLNTIYPDHYFTNMTDAELDPSVPARPDQTAMAI
ncbi:FkbM family methyltransferase [Acidiphilium sp. JA12-A1]|uniref:FkbM family methyltransferase n=1 Tax=Acidiphilium sp. JA12-A1 TaxID=1464546 RepID=UPI0004619FA9|nr:FkbM family methyltransferase [Acidiphilium sp. JA12-A1]KDM67250.1 FkbM family methyltransferase [Acidiphilium sp. JA12-A1]